MDFVEKNCNKMNNLLQSVETINPFIKSLLISKDSEPKAVPFTTKSRIQVTQLLKSIEKNVSRVHKVVVATKTNTTSNFSS